LDKSPHAFRTISEVAGELAVPKHVLRFWEGKFNQLRPMKRGGGRRYYRPEDVDLLRGIRLLLYEEGFTIKGVQKILREQGVRFVMGCWQPAAEGSEAAQISDIPDVALEAAQEAAAAGQFGPGRVIARSGASALPSAAQPAGSLNRAQVEQLDAVMAELEACRAVLSASKES